MSETRFANQPPSGKIEAPKVILEIGVGRSGPTEFWNAVIEERSLADNERYIGIDLGACTHPHFRTGHMSNQEASANDAQMHAKWAAIKESRPSEHITFLQADAVKLPIHDGVVDEVLMNNLLGTGIAPKMLRTVFQQTHRALKPEGSVIIHDNHMPRAELSASGLLNRWLGRQGLHIFKETGYVNAGKQPDAYVATAAYYGFQTAEPMRLRGTEGAISPRNTIWMLGKTSVKS